MCSNTHGPTCGTSRSSSAGYNSAQDALSAGPLVASRSAIARTMTRFIASNVSLPSVSMLLMSIRGPCPVPQHLTKRRMIIAAPTSLSGNMLRTPILRRTPMTERTVKNDSLVTRHCLRCSCFFWSCEGGLVVVLEEATGCRLLASPPLSAALRTSVIPLRYPFRGSGRPGGSLWKAASPHAAATAGTVPTARLIAVVLRIRRTRRAWTIRV